MFKREIKQFHSMHATVITQESDCKRTENDGSIRYFKRKTINFVSYKTLMLCICVDTFEDDSVDVHARVSKYLKYSPTTSRQVARFIHEFCDDDLRECIYRTFETNEYVYKGNCSAQKLTDGCLTPDVYKSIFSIWRFDNAELLTFDGRCF